MNDTAPTQQHADQVRAAAQQAFRNHLDHLAAGRVAEWADLFTEDGVLEFPYAPKGYPTRLTGRRELLAHMANFAEQFRVRFTDLRFHETVDPSLVIAELKGEGLALKTNRSYDQSYISVVETSDGKISHYVDYWNPLAAIDALGGEADDMVSAFSDD
ncbi:ketosteroid isomerase-like protein [Saccharothrix coeruleofusca]|uniref:nuclear transport factor 2 family protein n=1 Tax=Saccharothrix coeruleofusca TaxID=33919 RepID=UPI001AE59567|nr:nuclear transport factor 2 family protein [Saccharothrix coeruleofusca]MBP2336578.1 ketosteroid isomerase-like protein [Saccharothrix coeruleofusca]